MTTSTEGILCYGYILPDEGLPWQTDDYEDDFEEWYYSEVVPFNFSIDWDSADSILRKQYFDKKWEFKQANPAPFKLVNYCSWDYPMFILAVVREEATKGNPTIINPVELLEYSEKDIQELKEFAVKYNLIDETDKPQWWLCSYWG